MLAPVRLAATAPPMRGLSRRLAGGQAQAHINEKENPHTLNMVQWKLWAGLSQPICFFSTLLEVDFIELGKKSLAWCNPGIIISSEYTVF